MNKISKTTPTSGNKPRIVFFGNERIATSTSTLCPTLQKLIIEGYDIAAVVVNHEESVSRNRRKLEIADLAARYKIPVLAPKRLRDIANELKNLAADAGILVAYGKMVPQYMIDIFQAGIINIHPSLLPLHRGSTPIESVILAGENQTGVSLMRLVSDMDAGPIYAYSIVALEGNESKQHLANELIEIGSEMLLATLPKIINKEITGAPQDPTLATFDQLITKQDGILDFSRPAAQLEREVRAYLGWPGSRTTIAGKDVVVTAVHVADNSLENVDKKTIFVANKQLCIQAADGILVIDELKPAGKSAMSAAAFLAGYRHLL